MRSFDLKSQDEDNFDYESLPDKLQILTRSIDPSNFLDYVEPNRYLNDEVINFFIELFHTLIISADSKDRIV